MEQQCVGAVIAMPHAAKPDSQTMQPVKEVGGLSEAPSTDEARLGRAWAINIWNDMLG